MSNKTPVSKPLFLYPPVYGALLLAGMWALDRYFPLLRWNDSALITYAGWGLFFACWAGIAVIGRFFQRAETTIKPYEESDTLITAGPFRYSRNPIYVLMVASLTGAFVAFGSLAPALGPLIFPVILYWRFIRAEEAMLEEKFGEVFRAYTRRVRRWL